MKKAPSLEQWLERTRRLLDVERNEEIQGVQEELATLNDADNPSVLVNLKLVSCSTALFGRRMLKLVFPSVHLQHPKPHQFTVGDLVQLRLKTSSSSSAASGGAVAAALPTGIVARVEDTSISIALGDDQDIDEDDVQFQSLTVDRLVNNATFAKISMALDQLAKHEYGPAQRVVDVVFHGLAPSWNDALPPFSPLHHDLNASQMDAIQFALASKDLALIHGPPGTGKTTTVVELIRQAVTKYDMRVLVCAPSNIAVDNVLEKLAQTNSSGGKQLQLTRLGHPARLLPQVLRYCLDAHIEAAEGTEIVHDIRKETAAMQAKLQKTRDKGARYELRRELKANRKELRQREQRVVTELLRHSDVVLATNVGAASKLLDKIEFDLVVIDEAAQALEASCWIPILKGKRCVLAGDHLQLPPTIKSKAAAAGGLETTLFDRIARLESTRSVVKMLKTQYRMHHAISDWSSTAMYKGELESFEGVAHRKLHELAHTRIDADDDVLNATLLLVDTAGCGLDEDQDDDANDAKKRGDLLKLSKSNQGEARVVVQHVQSLLLAGLRQEEVAVITPYNKQVQLLKALLLDEFPRLEIRSVDGFQGCEKEAVVMSLVRSNDRREVGFLADDRRMNVAVTRAKRHVALVCDTETISTHKFLEKLVMHFEEHGEYRSAQELLDADLVHGDAVDLQGIASASAKSASSPAVAQKEERKCRSVGTSKPNSSNKTKRQPVKTTSSANKSWHTPPRTKTYTQASVPTEKTAARDVEGDDSDHSDAGEAGEVISQTNAFDMMASDSSDSGEADEDGDENEEKSSVANGNDDLKSATALLKDLHLSRMARQAPPPAPATTTTSKKSKNKKTKKNKAKAAAATTTNAPSKTAGTAPVGDFMDGEDELDFLTRQAASNNKCTFQHATTAVRCKKSTAMMGSVCKFCKLKFCYDHAQPEVHGCSTAVREFERQQFQQQVAKSTSDQKKLSLDKRKLLQRKLESKVSEQASGRKAKGKAKDKAK
ncbi:TPA: hypothetical protein N0F65_009342 [Lagenidium giganteum]|uniref:DNA helicase n=1 Tax=Lagenidium giganteum TaxID=4803 RepID=A0AAV2YKJ3_9STRA|nr:TPA: hypothetical protein N0F65_009342 [Lagenidium giganteum]